MGIRQSRPILLSHILNHTLDQVLHHVRRHTVLEKVHSVVRIREALQALKIDSICEVWPSKPVDYALSPPKYLPHQSYLMVTLLYILLVDA
jgi:hypothetical protein